MGQRGANGVPAQTQQLPNSKGNSRPRAVNMCETKTGTAACCTERRGSFYGLAMWSVRIESGGVSLSNSSQSHPFDLASAKHSSRSEGMSSTMSSATGINQLPFPRSNAMSAFDWSQSVRVCGDSATFNSCHSINKYQLKVAVLNTFKIKQKTSIIKRCDNQAQV